jgi:hypothetical protein
MDERYDAKQESYRSNKLGVGGEVPNTRPPSIMERLDNLEGRFAEFQRQTIEEIRNIKSALSELANVLGIKF